MKTITAILASTLAIAIAAAPAEATQPDRCRTYIKQGTFYTSCWTGHYAITIHTNKARVSTWYHRSDPTFKVTCTGRITRQAAPVPLCPRPQMHTFQTAPWQQP